MDHKQQCPLCLYRSGDDFFQDKHRFFLKCSNCQLIFVPPQFFLSPEVEKSRYDTHQNLPEDPRYRGFLSHIFEPVQQRLAPNSQGLDFGSGPGPTLSVMFEEIGHQMTIYDRFYAHQPDVLKKSYDFITTSETVEHLQQPRSELEQLWSCVKPNGILGIMTQFVPSQTDFDCWYYKNDPTHLCFYDRPAFHWLATNWSTSPQFVADNVVLFVKHINKSYHYSVR